MAGEDLASIKVMYCIVAVQCFIKLGFLIRCFDHFGTLIRQTGFIIVRMCPYLAYAFGFNVLFAILYEIAGLPLPEELEYSEGFGYFIFALQNGMGYYNAFSPTGFLPDSLIGQVALDDEPGSEFADGRITIQNLSWTIWFFNVLFMGVILFSMLIAIV